MNTFILLVSLVVFLSPKNVWACSCMSEDPPKLALDMMSTISKFEIIKETEEYYVAKNIVTIKGLVPKKFKIRKRISRTTCGNRFFEKKTYMKSLVFDAEDKVFEAGGFCDGYHFSRYERLVGPIESYKE